MYVLPEAIEGRACCTKPVNTVYVLPVETEGTAWCTKPVNTVYVHLRRQSVLH